MGVCSNSISFFVWLVGFIFNFSLFLLFFINPPSIVIILSLFGLRFFLTYPLILGPPKCIPKLCKGTRIVYTKCFFLYFYTIFLSSNYVLRLLTYIFKKKYWLDGSKISIFMYIPLVRYYLILVWWSLL